MWVGGFLEKIEIKLTSASLDWDWAELGSFGPKVLD